MAGRLTGQTVCGGRSAAGPSRLFSGPTVVGPGSLRRAARLHHDARLTPRGGVPCDCASRSTGAARTATCPCLPTSWTRLRRVCARSPLRTATTTRPGIVACVHTTRCAAARSHELLAPARANTARAAGAAADQRPAAGAVDDLLRPSWLLVCITHHTRTRPQAVPGSGPVDYPVDGCRVSGGGYYRIGGDIKADWATVILAIMGMAQHNQHSQWHTPQTRCVVHMPRRSPLPSPPHTAHTHALRARAHTHKPWPPPPMPTLLPWFRELPPHAPCPCVRRAPVCMCRHDAWTRLTEGMPGPRGQARLLGDPRRP